MALSQLFAENALVRLFLGKSEQPALVKSMTGVKLGERVLVIGLSDPALLSTLGSKVGITGRACGIDVAADRVARAARRAERDGVLAEAEQADAGSLPFDRAGFDIVVVRAAADLAAEPALSAALAAAREALRDGGRCQVIVSGGPGGLRRLWSRDAPGPPARRVVEMLASVGFRGARVLAEREGLGFVEGVSRVDPPHAG